MSSIKNRLDKLEAAVIPQEPTRIYRFIVKPNTVIRGFTCSGVTIMRQPGENLDELMDRCSSSIQIQGNARLILEPVT